MTTEECSLTAEELLLRVPEEVKGRLSECRALARTMMPSLVTKKKSICVITSFEQEEERTDQRTPVNVTKSAYSMSFPF